LDSSNPSDLDDLFIEQTISLEFESEEDCRKFYLIFEELGRDARDRTWEHLLEVGKVRRQ
jgi:hypothetical protein